MISELHLQYLRLSILSAFLSLSSLNCYFVCLRISFSNLASSMHCCVLGVGLLTLWFISSGKSHWMLANTWPFNNILNKDNWTGTRRLTGEALWDGELSFANCWASKILGSLEHITGMMQGPVNFSEKTIGTLHTAFRWCRCRALEEHLPHWFQHRLQREELLCKGLLLPLVAGEQLLREEQLDGSVADGGLWLM